MPVGMTAAEKVTFRSVTVPACSTTPVAVRLLNVEFGIRMRSMRPFGMQRM